MKLRTLTSLLITGFLFIAACVSLSATLQAKDRIKLKDSLVFDGSEIKHRPGDTFHIEPGQRTKLTIRNFNGEAGKPITFINDGEVVDINNQNGSGGAINISGCNHIRLTGTGSPEHRYGIRISCGKKGPHALNVINRSSFIEIDHIEVYGAGFAGFNVKDEPSHERKTTRSQFVMRHISLHDNYVHNTIGEGFYIGHTFYEGYDPKKTGKPIMPHVIKGLRVYNNLFEDTGCEAIQIGSATEDCEVYHNTMRRTGIKPFANYQDNGMQIGAGTQARVYNNLIDNSKGNSVVMFGEGEIYFENNFLLNAGKNGMYINTKGADRYFIKNNTIAHPKKNGILIGNWRKPPAEITMQENLFVMEGASGEAFVNQNAKAEIKERKNKILKDSAKLTNVRVGAGFDGAPSTILPEVAPLTDKPPTPWKTAP